jgi:hypothetical protein
MRSDSNGYHCRACRARESNPALRFAVVECLQDLEKVSRQLASEIDGELPGYPLPFTVLVKISESVAKLRAYLVMLQATGRQPGQEG